MTHVVTIDQPEGTVTINEELFRGYIHEAFEHLTDISEANNAFKEVVDTMAKTTGMKPAKVSKYLKQRFDVKTKETRELGELFTKLDEVLS